MKEKIEDILWTIKAFIYQPVIFRKSIEWIIEHEGSYNGISANNKWVYYWVGDFKKGKQYKVLKSENDAYVARKDGVYYG